MNLFSISRKNFLSKPWRNALSILLCAAGIALVSVIHQVTEQSEKQFSRNLAGIDMVVGAKGSPLQLILSAVYHIDAPTGNIPLKQANNLLRNPLVKKAIPLAYGDTYAGFRIVGTTQDYPALYAATLSAGRWWAADLEVCIGTEVALQHDLQPGSTFTGNHGGDAENGHEDHHYLVTGILAPTGTVLDRLVLTSVSSVWAVHAPETADTAAHASEKEITAMLVEFKSPMAALRLPRNINENTMMQAAIPAIEINRLVFLMGTGTLTLAIMGYGILTVAAFSMFVSLLQAAEERKHELALMRSMGASPIKIVLLLLTESAMLAFSGWICGIVAGRIAVFFIGQQLRKELGYHLEFATITPLDIQLLGISAGIALLAALVPAVRLYRLNISTVLGQS